MWQLLIPYKELYITDLQLDLVNVTFYLKKGTKVVKHFNIYLPSHTVEVMQSIQYFITVSVR